MQAVSTVDCFTKRNRRARQHSVVCQRNNVVPVLRSGCFDHATCQHSAACRIGGDAVECGVAAHCLIEAGSTTGVERQVESAVDCFRKTQVCGCQNRVVCQRNDVVPVLRTRRCDASASKDSRAVCIRRHTRRIDAAVKVRDTAGAERQIISAIDGRAQRHIDRRQRRVRAERHGVVVSLVTCRRDAAAVEDERAGYIGRYAGNRHCAADGRCATAIDDQAERTINSRTE